MTETEKIEFLGGQVHALIGFATAMITADDNPERLQKHLNIIGEVSLARAEGSLVPESYIDGVLDVRDRLRRAVEMALKQRATPNKG